MAMSRYLKHGIDAEYLPFEISGLTIISVLRWLPGSRLVVDGLWKGKRVVAKLFRSGRKGRKALKRELRSLEAIAARQVRCPSVEDALMLEDGVSMLVMEKLAGESALSYCSVDDSSLRKMRISELVCWVRDTQRHGVIQTDIHPGNFFYTPEGWALLDAAECRVGSFSRRRERTNLASLLAQFSPLDVPEISSCFAGLGDYRPALAVARRKRYKKILKKALRSCSEFGTIQQGSIRGMCRRDCLLQVEKLLARGLDEVMEVPTSLKLGGASTVVRDDISGWVIKRYNIKSLLHWMKRQWGPTRAKNAWIAGIFLREIGVQTPLPLAYLEERRFGCKQRAWIINDYESGHGLDELPEDQSAPELVSRALADFFWLMAQLGFRHGDMKASNVLVTASGASIIDLDAFDPFYRSPQVGYRKDMARLMRNWSEDSALRTSLERTIAVKVGGYGESEGSYQ
jgi:tRNA A-37 threonylcarbamoyl transferase component Bud32